MSLVRRLFPEPDQREASFLGDLFRREAVGGAIALVAAVVGIVWANSAWAASYFELRHVEIGPLDVEHWAADGALTLFFFVAGLELKRELVIGSLRRPADAAVPVAAAVCGVAVPALLYLAINANGGHPEGWAVPAATDIAFALAVLAVVGSNLPTALRAFLLTLAVVDDLIVIVIIAVFFTDSLDFLWLAVALAAMVAWMLLQRARVSTPLIYVPLAVLAWWAVHECGVHATIAGVALGLLTRVRHDPGEETSPAEHLEHVLSPVSSALAVPFFALMSAGVVLDRWGRAGERPDRGRRGRGPRGRQTGRRLRRRLAGGPLHPRRARPVDRLAGRGRRRRAGRHRLHRVAAGLRPVVRRASQRDAAKTAVLAGSVVSAVLGALVLGHRDRFRATP